MSWFAWNACCYGLLLVGFLGTEAQRQRLGRRLPAGARVIHFASGALLLGWPLAIGIGDGDQLTAREQLACAVTPFALLGLFCAHMAARAAWRERCERREQERERS